jgi:hypothetical protein
LGLFVELVAKLAASEQNMKKGIESLEIVDISCYCHSFGSTHGGQYNLNLALNQGLEEVRGR